MPGPQIAATIDTVTHVVDLAKVSGLDALVYRQETGRDLEAELTQMMARAPESDDEWGLLDRTVIKWLSLRHHVDPDVSLALVAASVTMFPGSPAGSPAGVVDASDHVSAAPAGSGAG